MSMVGGTDAATTAANLYSLSALAALHSNLVHFGGGGPSPALDFSLAATAASLGPEADARNVDYRGEKVAGFRIDEKTMICLPQAYELFLKNLVGGLHTVYTKLKRLDIIPRICNVEQVRALRSMGAIQPGVNRCKLISCDDFDVLYQDCTSSSSSRPGRPPKRSPPFALDCSGIAPMPPMPLKKPRQDQHDAMGGGLFGFLPGLPFTAQQLMVQRMLNAQLSGGLGSPLGGSAKAEETERGTMQEQLSPSHTSWSRDKEGGVEKKSPPPSGEGAEWGTGGGDWDGDRSSATATPKTLASPPQHPPNILSNGWPGMSTEAPVNATETVNVESLLRNALSLIHLAANSAKSFDTIRKDNGDLRGALETERRQRFKLETALKKEWMMRRLYEKRYRNVRRSKTRLHKELLRRLEEANPDLRSPIGALHIVEPTAPPMS